MPPRVPKVLYSKPLTSPELSLPEGFVRFEDESGLSYRFGRRFPWLSVLPTDCSPESGAPCACFDAAAVAMSSQPDAMVVSVDPKPMRRSGVITYATALRLGKCCVVNDPSGASSYIRHGETGYLVPSEDPLALRHQIEFLLANPALIESTGHAASQDLRFTPEHLLRSITEEVTKLTTGA